MQFKITDSMRNGIKQKERPGGIARQRYLGVSVTEPQNHKANLLKNAMQLREKANVKAKQKQQQHQQQQQ